MAKCFRLTGDAGWNSRRKVALFAFICLLGLQQALAQRNTGSARPLSDADSSMVQQLYFSALREKTIENLKLAADLFGRVLQIDPANDASMYELATLKKIDNDYNSAQQLLEKAVSLNQDNKWYWTALAECYEKNNDIDKLQNVFSQLIRLDPGSVNNYFDLANVYYRQQKYDEALKIYDEAEKVAGPSDDLLADRQRIYLKENRVDLAEQQLQKAIASAPGEIKYYLYLAQLYNANTMQDKALSTLKDAEKYGDGSGLVNLALADIYRDKKDYSASYDELTKAFANPNVDIDQEIKIILGYLPRFSDPNVRASAIGLSRILTVAHGDNAKAWAVYGDMLLQDNQLKDAAQMYRKSIALDNQVYEVQEQLVRIELGLGNYDSAIKEGENALSYFPNQAWMNYLVGAAWLQKRKYHQAISYLKNAITLADSDKDLLSQSFSALGDSYHSINDDNNSDAAYDKAVSYDPDNAFTLNNYAYYLSLRGEKLDKAAAMAKHANDLQPNNASFEDTYAWILFKQKDYAAARTWIEKAIADDKTNSAVKAEHYGDIMFCLGDVEAAVDSWKKAKADGDQSVVLEKKINERKYIQ